MLKKKMSFIIKRERIFNTGELYDLPARNEGKLKAFASCTDTRAWSHFATDQTEHLMEFIKRNNEMCRPKYIPTDVIVNTLMGTKNSEIMRLKRKIGEFEQMLAVYDQLDLTIEQKKEIAVAHNAIRAANKELYDLSLDLDLTGFTELDTESFRTGKSGGDASERSRDNEIHKIQLQWPEYVDKNFFDLITDPKENKISNVVTCEISTNVTDPRLDEFSDTIIEKDAKLNAMNNTIAVLESDAYEPYCLYAHIYTAIEKIFGILCQNEDYKKYLHLLSTSQDEIGSIDIKGRILLKLKVLEKFSIALIAPCIQRKSLSISTPSSPVSNQVEAAYAVTISDIPKSNYNVEAKRNELILDIMNNDDIKSVLEKQSDKQDNIQEYFTDDNYDIETNNLNRLKNLQFNYDELMASNEKLRDECNRLQNKCANYETLQFEVEDLREVVKEYNILWNEKEHFKRRSSDLDSLKEQFFVLSEETLHLENQLITESARVVEVAAVNSNLEQKISNITMSFDKDKNVLECKLKEAECKILCQEQQIKSMSDQINRLLENDNNTPEEQSPHQIFLLNEIKTLKGDIDKLKNIIIVNEKDKQELQGKLEEKVQCIDSLTTELENLKGTAVRDENPIDLQKDLDQLKNETDKLKDVNFNLTLESNEKTKAMDNLMGIINNKSAEINKLIEQNEQQKSVNDSLNRQLKSIEHEFNIKVSELEADKQDTLSSLLMAQQESEHLLNECHEIKQSSSSLINNLDELKATLDVMTKENNKLQKELDLCRIREESLRKEIVDLNYEKMAYITELDNEKKYSKNIKNQLTKSINEHIDISKNLHDKNSDLNLKNEELLRKLQKESSHFENVIESLNVSRRQSEELLRKSKEELSVFSESYQQEKDVIEKELLNKDLELKYLIDSYNNLKQEHDNTLNSMAQIQQDYDELKAACENRITDSMSIESRDLSTKSSISSIKKDNEYLREKINEYQDLEEQLNMLQQENDKLTKRLKLLEKEFEVKNDDYNRLKEEFDNIEEHNKELISQNDTLTNTLLNTKNELYSNSSLSRLIEEVETIKKEKLMKQIHNDNDDPTIESLTKIVADREEKIAQLENHINDLKDELQQLQDNFASLIKTSEEIKEISLQNIDNSLKSVESKHTQYTADIIQEMEDLRKANELLEKQATVFKEKAQESYKQNEVLTAQIKQMNDDKNLILENLRMLKINDLDNTDIKPENYNTDDILKIMNNIKKSIDSNYSKTSLLESKLLNVQTSSQILQSKADEAKLILAKEKSKILNEKEDAIREKLNLENQLKHIQETLQNQIANDESIIAGLKAELESQQLLIGNINKSNEETLLKLNEELTEIQELYLNTLKKLDDLQSDLMKSNIEKEGNNGVIEKLHIELNQKVDEIARLRQELSLLCTKSTSSESSENKSIQRIEKSVQTEEFLISDSSVVDSSEVLQGFNEASEQPYRKEVQVLTASVEPDNKFIQSKYNVERLKDLSRRPINLVTLDELSNSLSNETNHTENNATDNQSSGLEKMYKVLQDPIQNIENIEPSLEINIDIECQNDENDEIYSTEYDGDNKRNVDNKMPVVFNDKNILGPNEGANENYSQSGRSSSMSKLLKDHERLDTTSSEPQISDYYKEVTNKDDLSTKHVSLIGSLFGTEDNSNLSASKNNYFDYLNQSYSIADDDEANNSDILYNSNDAKGENNSLTPLKLLNKSVSAKLDKSVEEYELKIISLSNELIALEKDYKNKIDGIKSTYDDNMQSLLIEHEQSIQNLKKLNERRFRDIIKTHEIEIDNLTLTNIETAERAAKCDKENKILKLKLQGLNQDVEKEPVRLSARSNKKKGKTSLDIKNLTKTNIQAVDVEEKTRNIGPCTCTPDINLSDTIRSIFDQVDMNQRKSEHDYLKYIVDKIIKTNINALNTQELSFLHLNVCRIWKMKMCEHDDLKLRLRHLESDFDDKHRHAQQQLINLDRLMEEESMILKNARADLELSQFNQQESLNYSKNVCCCPPDSLIEDKCSVRDLVKAATRPRRKGPDNQNRAILVKLEPDDDPPMKLRRSRISKK